MRILSRLNPDSDSENGSPQSGPVTEESENGAGAPEVHIEDAGRDNHPSRDKGDIYIETNDVDNTVFEDPVQEKEARDGLFDLATAALRSQGVIKGK